MTLHAISCQGPLRHVTLRGVFRRVVLILCVLALGSGIAAADTRTRRIVRSFRTCDMAECPDAVKKLYEQEPTVELVTMGIGGVIAVRRDLRRERAMMGPDER